MQRIDRERLLRAELPARHDIYTRFSDADIQGHVNNVATVELLQEGRIAFNRRVGLHRYAQGIGTVVAAIQVEYAAQLDWQVPVVSHVGVLAIGRTSYTIGQVLVQDEVPATFCECTLVLAGPNGTAELPDELRSNLEKDLIA